MPFRRSFRSACCGLLLLSLARHARAQEPLFDSAGVRQVDGATCYQHARYTVVARERQGEVGSDIVVHAGPGGPCTGDSVAGDYVFHNEWAEYFAGLIGDDMVLDSGTGPDLRGLIVIDLTTRRRVFDGSYVELEAGGPAGSLGIWQGYELTHPGPGCEAPDGLGPGVDSLVWLDLRSGRVRYAGRTRCAVRQ